MTAPRKPGQQQLAGPLTSVRVLVGRARHQASVLSEGLRKQGADVIEIPFIEIRTPRSYRPFDAALRRISEYDWLILTSVNGVEALATRLKHLRIATKDLKHLNVAAIGPATAREIKNLGLEVAVVPPRYIAESLVESLRDRVAGKRVLLARAKVARDVIPPELRKLGARVDVVEAYETEVPESSRGELRRVMTDPATRPNVIAFTSSSTARNFVELLRGQESLQHAIAAGVKLASIGPVTSATLRQLGLHPQIEASEFTIPGLISAIGEAMISASRKE
jgi:uroporphyrinogen-III synthase